MCWVPFHFLESLPLVLSTDTDSMQAPLDAPESGAATSPAVVKAFQSALSTRSAKERYCDRVHIRRTQSTSMSSASVSSYSERFNEVLCLLCSCKKRTLIPRSDMGQTSSSLIAQEPVGSCQQCSLRQRRCEPLVIVGVMQMSIACQKCLVRNASGVCCLTSSSSGRAKTARANQNLCYLLLQ